jgi:cytochrome P450
MDPPATTVIRRPLAVAFSERNIEKHRATVEAIAARLAARKPGDLIADYCAPFIAEVATATMGLPIGDWPHILELAGKGLGIVKSPDEAAERIAGWRDLYAYSRTIVDRQNDDRLILAEIVAALGHAGLSDETALHTVATVIVGLATPIGALAIVAYELLGRRELLRACLDDSALWRPAISETMRYRANFGLALPRVALEDVRVNDNLTIKRGQVVVPSLLAAAHDPARTRRPYEVDLDQEAARNIVFGAGAHFCPGAALGRQWLEVGIATLFQRWPGLRVTGELEWQAGTLSVPTAIPVG